MTRIAGVPLLFLGALLAQGQTVGDVPVGSPAAVVDLTTARGASMMRGEWRYSDTRIIQIEFPGPGPDGQPTGERNRTYDLEPRAGIADFDDSDWEVIAPESLKNRRSTGRLCFNWYRIRLTVPGEINGFKPTGSTLVFETSVDDYAEIWVDGELSRSLGQSGGSVIAGWNARNSLVVGRSVVPGQVIQLAVFGANGPLSNPPTNFIWMRYARLLFFHGGEAPLALTPAEVNVTVESHDPRMRMLTGPNPKMFKLAEGFQFTEGPVWIPSRNALLLSDPNANAIYEYSSEGALRVFKYPSGYSGSDSARYKQPGSNGLALTPTRDLAINQHGNRRVLLQNADGTEAVLVSSYQGKRLNSPNDLVFRSDGTLYFTDPPFGLPRVFDDEQKELSFSGVYAVRNGDVKLITDQLSGPNGLALSPDERSLYVGNWDARRKVVMRYAIAEDGSARDGRLFVDLTPFPGEEGIDGIKADQSGNVYVAGPGGLSVFSPEGNHLGTIRAPRHIHNMAWGDADGRTLYLCAQSALYRMRLTIPGAGRLDLTRPGDEGNKRATGGGKP